MQWKVSAQFAALFSSPRTSILPVDIGLVVEFADKLVVTYAGEFVETGSVRELIRDARHPYTRGLLAPNLRGARKGERLKPIRCAGGARGAPTACSLARPCPLPRQAATRKGRPRATLG